MKRSVRGVKSLVALLILFAGMTGMARAADLSQAVILVASERLAGSLYEETVVLAAPLPQGGHMGFVVNRPTSVKLENVFPKQASTHNVVEPVYAGGPALSRGVFAVTRNAPANGDSVVPLMPGLVVAIDGDTVDRIIETTPNDARYFVGLMIWAPEERDEEIEQGAWNVRPADVDTVLRAGSPGLWKSLSGTRV